MRYQHIIEAVYNRPWLITPGGHAAVRRLIESKLTPKAEGEEGISIEIDNPRKTSCLDEAGIGHIHICGVIGHRLGTMEKACGNTCVCEVRRELDSLVDQGAAGIFLNIDSPGGTVTGVVELADALAEIGESIPIYAFGDSLIASAAYWLAASARKIWCTESAEVGSVGVLFPWIDKSAAWAQIGIRFEPITNPEAIYKSAGHGPSLTDDQKAEIERSVARVYDLFHGFVVEGRAKAGSGVVEDALQGQTLIGLDAISYGLVDRIGTHAEAYSELCMEAGVFPINLPINESISPKFPLPARPGIESA